MSVFVAYIHFYNASYSAFPEYCAEQVFENMVSQGLARCAVPLFFIISGYLAFSLKDMDSQKCLENIPRKIRTLLVPFLIFNTLYLLYQAVLSIALQRVNILNITNVLKGIFLYQYNAPFWYVLQLFALCVLSPLLYYVYRNQYVGLGFLAVAACGYLFVTSNSKYFLLPGILFYSLGAMTAVHYRKQFDSSQWSKKTVLTVRAIAGICAIALLIIRFILTDISVDVSLLRETLPYKLFEFAFPITVWYSADLFRLGKLPCRNFEKYSFIIYATHWGCISVANAVLSKLPPPPHYRWLCLSD